MKALNSKERSDLFLKFTGLFVFAVVILVAALNFDFVMPAKLSEAHKSQLSEYFEFKKNEDQLVSQMQQMDSLINQITPQNQASVSSVDAILSRMKLDSNKTVLQVANVYGTYLSIKKNATSSSDDIIRLKEDNIKLRDDLNRKVTELAACQASKPAAAQ